MKDTAKLYAYIIGCMLVGCASIMLCYATYYVINDKELLFKLLGDLKIVVIAVGFYWIGIKFLRGMWEK